MLCKATEGGKEKTIFVMKSLKGKSSITGSKLPFFKLYTKRHLGRVFLLFLLTSELVSIKSSDLHYVPDEQHSQNRKRISSSLFHSDSTVIIKIQSL